MVILFTAEVGILFALFLNQPIEAKMKQTLPTVAALLMLTACGGVSSPVPQPVPGQIRISSPALTSAKVLVVGLTKAVSGVGTVHLRDLKTGATASAQSAASGTFSLVITAGPDRQLEAWFETYYRDSADGTTAISTALVHRALGIGVDPDAVIQLTGGTRPEVFPFQTIEECRANVPLALGNPVIGFASLDSHLDMELVLDALRIVSEHYPGVSLLVTGSPTTSLRDMAAARGIADRLVMSGLVPFEELSTYLGCADVCVLPLWDTTYNRGRWPNKITDYTTAGRPMVTNPVGDIEALVRRHEIGLLAGWTPDEFAGAIRNLLDNPEEAARLGRNARLLAEGELSWARRAEELELFYYARIAAKQAPLARN